MPRSKQKQLLTDHLREESVEIFVKFCCILIDLKRGDIIKDVFKLDPEHVKRQSGKYIKGPEVKYGE